MPAALFFIQTKSVVGSYQIQLSRKDRNWPSSDRKRKADSWMTKTSFTKIWHITRRENQIKWNGTKVSLIYSRVLGYFLWSYVTYWRLCHDFCCRSMGRKFSKTFQLAHILLVFFPIKDSVGWMREFLHLWKRKKKTIAVANCTVWTGPVVKARIIKFRLYLLRHILFPVSLWIFHHTFFKNLWIFL